MPLALHCAVGGGFAAFTARVHFKPWFMVAPLNACAICKSNIAQLKGLGIRLRWLTWSTTVGCNNDIALGSLYNLSEIPSEIAHGWVSKLTS